jgi:hypothetical protein
MSAGDGESACDFSDWDKHLGAISPVGKDDEVTASLGDARLDPNAAFACAFDTDCNESKPVIDDH